MKQKVKNQVPEIEQLKSELRRENQKRSGKTVLKRTVYTLVVVAAFAVLAATLWIPVLQIYGESMSPTLKEGQLVVSLKGSDFQRGDLVAFYIGNKLLVKRVIAGPGDTVDMKDDGSVFVNGEKLDEPYVREKALGECDIEFPYKVTENSYFLMGDNRKVSVDSRKNAVGCVSKEQIAGKIVLRIWPLNEITAY